jgi:hypothetical protein
MPISFLMPAPMPAPMTMRALALCLAAASLVGCAGGRDRPAPGCVATDLLGQRLAVPRGADMAACGAAVDRWFAAADTDHDGRLSAAEVEAWTRAVFAAADTDHDGAITSPEADAARRPPGAAQEPEGAPPRRRLRGNLGAGGGLARQSALMAADADLDFRVTEAELLAFARAALQRLDSDHDGVLSRDEARAGLAFARERAGGEGRPGGFGGHRRRPPGLG